MCSRRSLAWETYANTRPACGLHTHNLWQPHANGDANSHSNGNGDINGNCDSHRYGYGYHYCYAQTYAYAAASAHTEATPDAAASAVRLVDR